MRESIVAKVSRYLLMLSNTANSIHKFNQPAMAQRRSNRRGRSLICCWETETTLTGMVSNCECH